MMEVLKTREVMMCRRASEIACLTTGALFASIAKERLGKDSARL